MKHVNQAIQGSWAESTIKHYTGSIKHFICFCDSKQVLDSLHFPTDKFVLCAFIASSLGRHAGNTSHSHISALKAWHITHNMEWKGSSHLRYVLNSVHNLAPGSSKQPLHPPINVKTIAQLVEVFNLNSPLDAVVAACVATAF